MPNLDFFILIGFILCVGGLSSAMRGQWTSTPKHSHKTVVVYEGSALGYVVALMGLIIGLLGASQHFSRPFVTHDQAFKYIGYAFIGGIVLSAVPFVVNLFTRRGGLEDPATSGIINQPMSLQAAAKYLKIPEAELQEMAENGAVMAHHVNGKYVFDGEILQDLRGVLSRK